MQAIRVHHFGGLDALVAENVPWPTRCNGEVLLRVKAAGVGPWNAWIRSGRRAVLRAGGILVSAVSEPDQQKAVQRGVRALLFLVDVSSRRETQSTWLAR